MAGTPLLADLGPEALAAALDAHTTAYFASYAALPGAAFRTDGIVRRYVPPPAAPAHGDVKVA